MRHLGIAQNLAGRGGSRTLRALKRPNDFEDRGGHRAPSLPKVSFSNGTAIPLPLSAADRQVFEKEALVHLPALMRFARRLVGRDGDAEDLVQECYARALRFFHQYRRGSNCRAWLFRIMNNLHINRWQVRRRGPVWIPLDEAGDHHFFRNPLQEGRQGVEGNPEQAYFAANPAPEIQRALASLSPDFRTPLVLFDLEGFSYQEIARIMRIPVGTVRSRLNRARRRLQRLLVDYRRQQQELPVLDEAC